MRDLLAISLNHSFNDIINSSSRHRNNSLEALTIASMFFTGIAAGFIGTTAGGGALLMIPLLIFLGLPAQNAIATAKLAVVGTMSAGLYRFNRGGKVIFKIAIPAAVFATIGSGLGALVLVRTPNSMLEKIIGIFMIILLVTMLLDHTVGIRKKRLTSTWGTVAGYSLFFVTGFWGAIFGGQAIFATYILISLFGLDFLFAAGTRKLAGLCIALIAIVIYQIHGIIFWKYGIILLIGSTIGSYYGAAYGLKKGNKWIKQLFVIVVIAAAIKLLV